MTVCLISSLSLLLVLATFPLSLLLTVKVVKEYERAVIFRLGRLVSTNEKVDSMVVKTADGRGARPRDLLHPALCGLLHQGRHASRHIRCAAPGGGLAVGC